MTRAVLFTGCRPEIAAGPDGRILAVGEGARAAAGATAEQVGLAGRVLPGLGDAHLHLEWLAQRHLGLELGDCRSRQEVLARVRRRGRRLAADAWLVGRGWCNDAWPDPRFPDRHDLDRAGGGRPVLLVRKDGHSACLSTAALQAAGIVGGRPDPEDGVVDRDAAGSPAGIVREGAVAIARAAVPPPTPQALDAGMARALAGLAELGLTSVHTMDTGPALASLQRLRAGGRLPIRVVYNLPHRDLDAAARIGLACGFGDLRLRLWGVKAFLDGSLGSGTAEMLDGSGVAVLAQPDLRDLVERCVAARFNVVLHAIGDGAVRRALDALEPHAGAWPGWRPRIEHAQCVDPADMPRFRRAGVIASMQPQHAVADRELADREWGARAGHAYAWAQLARQGARLAFGSDAPVETADPLAGLAAATVWRRRAGWYPELALGRTAALRAYTRGVAWAAGLERQLGRLAPGLLCDLTVVDAGRVVATVVGGRPVSR